MDLEKRRLLSGISLAVLGIALIILFLYPTPSVLGFLITFGIFMPTAIYLVLIDCRNELTKMRKIFEKESQAHDPKKVTKK